jgi:hypothetical protein
VACQNASAGRHGSGRLAEASTVFFIAQRGSPAVRALFDGLPEPDCPPDVVQAGIGVVDRLSRGLADGARFLQDMKGDTPAGLSVIVKNGFRMGDPVEVRARLSARAELVPLSAYLPEVRLVQVRVGGPGRSHRIPEDLQ